MALVLQLEGFCIDSDNCCCQGWLITNCLDANRDRLLPIFKQILDSVWNLLEGVQVDRRILEEARIYIATLANMKASRF